jgi:hypothetical protein
MIAPCGNLSTHRDITTKSAILLMIETGIAVQPGRMVRVFAHGKSPTTNELFGAAKYANGVSDAKTKVDYCR